MTAEDNKKSASQTAQELLGHILVTHEDGPEMIKRSLERAAKGDKLDQNFIEKAGSEIVQAVVESKWW